MALQPVRSSKTYEAVAQQLKDHIFNGVFPPGSKLPSVRQLSEQMSVSTSAIREALSALQAMRIVTMRQGEGTFVNSFNPDEVTQFVAKTPLIRRDDIRSLLELRLIVETGTARLAAHRRTPGDLDELWSIVHRMRAELTSFSVGEQADWAFHYGIAQAAKNPFLVSLMDAIGEQIQSSLLASRQALYQIEGEPETLLQQHERILQAVVDKRADAAEQAMREHLRHVEETLQLNAP
ncbi:GntR family transcriptional regulator [Alicyclobacillus contaminans]|uniref:FadR/GntR family transcriptional regulator n=1 Tax=Alicyclobacillus contaminans TaxID=392016 RepID=UPI0004295913|nr:FadR/GntR family transcriptional regulator [Alicyclobacillus contaminans]GMA51775.1 GntR family transcriptional regulator [Alicyclobacillus contaminans]